MDTIKKIFSESTVSLVLGIAVVVMLGLVAYKFFSTRKQTVLPPTTTTTQTTIDGNSDKTFNQDLTTPSAAVSLPVQHTVAAGETLWSISSKYFSSGYNWKDIASVNGLKNANKIYVGQKLTIPAVAAKVAITQPTQTIVPTVTLSKIDNTNYTVLKGDNLWTISVRAYGDGYRWQQIAQANHLKNPRLIHAGNVLIIPRP